MSTYADGSTAQQRPTRVLVADHEAIVREGLRRILDRHPDLTCVGEVASASEIVAAAATHEADVVVSELAIPEGNVLGVIAELDELSRPIPTVALSRGDEVYAAAARCAGAAAYLDKGASVDGIVDAIRRATEPLPDGETRRSRKSGAMRSAARGPRVPQSELIGLSPRETQVLQYVALGHTSDEIANRLSINIKTVEGYRARLRIKLNVKDRAALVKEALRRGLLD